MWAKENSNQDIMEKMGLLDSSLPYAFECVSLGLNNSLTSRKPSVRIVVDEACFNYSVHQANINGTSEMIKKSLEQEVMAFSPHGAALIEMLNTLCELEGLLE